MKEIVKDFKLTFYRIFTINLFLTFIISFSFFSEVVKVQKAF